MARYIVHNCYLALGWICLLLGGIGIIVPGMPTTIFWILSLWAFTRSSDKMRRYLLSHPKFGKILREWNDYRVVPRAGKIASCFSMVAVCVLSVLTMDNVWGATMICFTLTLVMGYIATRPSHISEVRSTTTVM